MADFEHERFLYDAGGAGLGLFTQDAEYVGGPDEWEMARTEGGVVGLWNPRWLLSVVGGAIEATKDGTEVVLGQRCERYSGFASFSEADARANRPPEPPSTAENPDVDRLPLWVWLDGTGRICKAELQIDGGSMLIELSEFGLHPPLELPDPNEVWTADDES